MIRKLEKGDREIFPELCEEFYHTGGVDHEVPRSYFEKTFDTIVNGTPYADGYLILDGETPVGYALFSFTWSNESGGICCWFEELYIRPDYQGKGFGTEMFRFLETMDIPGLRRYRLEVTRTNVDAIRLYKKLGYEKLEYDQYIKELPEI